MKPVWTPGKSWPVAAGRLSLRRGTSCRWGRFPGAAYEAQESPQSSAYPALHRRLQFLKPHRPSLPPPHCLGLPGGNTGKTEVPLLRMLRAPFVTSSLPSLPLPLHGPWLQPDGQVDSRAPGSGSSPGLGTWRREERKEGGRNRSGR